MCKGCWYRIILDAFEDRLSPRGDENGAPDQAERK
jgi:hypothetical protein